MEMDDEVKGSGNFYDFGARMYDPRIGRWMACDPFLDRYPSFTVYGYSGNSPIFLLDPNGKWIVKFNDDNTGIEFVAEDGDNLQTLSTQLGIGSEELLEAYPDFENKVWSADDVETLVNLEVVSNINDFIANQGSSRQANCAGLADQANGGNIGEWVYPEVFRDQLIENYSNVALIDAQIGDIVNYSYSDEELNFYSGQVFANEFLNIDDPNAQWNSWDQYEDFLESEEWANYKSNFQKTMSEHFSVVLLMSKDGSSIQNIIQKPGKSSITISDYPGQDISTEDGRNGPIFEAIPINSDNTPIYNQNTQANDNEQ